MIPKTIPNSSYLAKVAVKSTPDLPDVGDLPLGVVSLAGLPPDGSSGPEKVSNDSLHYQLDPHIAQSGT